MGSSVSNFGGSQMSSSVKDPKEDSFDLEDFGDVMESIQLQSALEESRRKIEKVNPK